MQIENVNGGGIHMSRIPFGRTYRYFLKVKSIDVRISKDLYRQIKRIVEGW